MNTTGVALGGLDVTFDYLVSLMAPKKVRFTSRQYADFAEMKADYERTGYIYVNVDHSDKTIFGSPVVNWQFRAWHDLCHIQANADFSPEGEAKAASLMSKQIVTLVKDGGIPLSSARRFRAIIEAEVNGQSDYYHKHGSFPEDQRAFVREYLAELYGYTAFPQTLDGFTVAY